MEPKRVHVDQIKQYVRPCGEPAMTDGQFDVGKHIKEFSTSNSENQQPEPSGSSAGNQRQTEFVPSPLNTDDSDRENEVTYVPEAWSPMKARAEPHVQRQIQRQKNNRVQTQKRVEKQKPSSSPSREKVLKRYSTTSVAENATPTTTRSGRVSKPTQRLNLSVVETPNPGSKTKSLPLRIPLNPKTQTVPDSWEDLSPN